MTAMPSTQADWNTQIEIALDAGLDDLASWMKAERDRQFPIAIRWVARRSVINARTDEDAAMGSWTADRSNWAASADDARTVLADQMDEEAHDILTGHVFVTSLGVHSEALDRALNLVRAAMRVRLNDLDVRTRGISGEAGHIDTGGIRWSFGPTMAR